MNLPAAFGGICQFPSLITHTSLPPSSPDYIMQRGSNKKEAVKQLSITALSVERQITHPRALNNSHLLSASFLSLTYMHIESGSVVVVVLIPWGIPFSLALMPISLLPPSLSLPNPIFTSYTALCREKRRRRAWTWSYYSSQATLWTL